MSIKSILVHIADDEDHLARFKAAKGLAACFDAHLTALYVTSPVHFKAAMVGRGASVGYEREKVAFAERKMKEIENEFREYLDNNDIDLEWVVNDGEHLERLTYHRPQPARSVGATLSLPDTGSAAWLGQGRSARTCRHRLEAQPCLQPGTSRCHALPETGEECPCRHHLGTWQGRLP